jgi:hypothetical protein
VGHVFRGCSHSVMFRPPCSLDPHVAPTAVNYILRAAGPFTPRNGHVVTHMNCGIATCLNRAIGIAGLSPYSLPAFTGAFDLIPMVSLFMPKDNT